MRSSPILRVKNNFIANQMVIVDSDGTELSREFAITEYNTKTKEAVIIKTIKMPSGVLQMVFDEDRNPVTFKQVFPNSHLEFLI